MDSATLVPLVVAAAVVVTVAVAAVVILAVVLAGRRRLERELHASRAELDAVSERVEQLSTQVDETGRDRSGLQSDRRKSVAREFVITSLPNGDDALAARDDEAPATQQLSVAQFASIAFGESLVRVLSVGYGVGRALSPENRNRIRFAVRQEVRRARRQRRRDLKEAQRHLRAQQVGDVGADLSSKPDADAA